MARYWKLMLCMVVVLIATTVASAQSLGDVARKERSKQKPQAARTYTNEEIPSADIPKEEPKDATAATADANVGEEKKDASKSGEKSVVETQKAKDAEWKSKVSDAKAAVASLEREINLMEREERLRVAVYYSDAGNRLRNSKDWDDQEQKYRDDLAARQKDLSSAKAKLDDTREAARKAGANGYDN
jgi:hypothetical protein